jgi:AraC-like DNA-binding protein
MVGIFYIGSIFCAFITIYLLLYNENAIKTFANYLLASYFVFQISCLFVYVLIIYGWIIDVPYIYKISAPINFLLPPLTYLYVRLILFNKQKLNKLDFLHTIPFILVIINYFPFYLLPISNKKDIVLELLKDINTSYKIQLGYLSEYIINVFRIFQSLIYLIFQWKLIITFNKQNKNNAVEKQINNIIKWLRIFTLTSTSYLTAFILLAAIALINNNIDAEGFIYHLPDYIFASCFFIISTYLLTHPSIFPGLPFIKYKETASNLILNQTDSIPYIEQDYSTEIETIKQYFESKKPYLIKGLNISQVSVEINISTKLISFIINQYFEMRFTEFINNYRVSYIKDKINEKYLDSFTFNTLASEAGFSNLTTFIAAFKKIENCTPSEYLLKLKS